jgi:energy-coupling factor transport system substrate-specific component
MIPATPDADRALLPAAPGEEGRAPKRPHEQTLVLTLVPVGIALNLAIGTVVSTLKLPVYLDAIGTIVVTLLAGLRAGVIVGIGSNLASALVANPVQLWFCGTQAAIALYSHLLARLHGFSTFPRTLLTGSGTSLITAYLLSTGKTLLNSVILSGLASEPLDKGLQCLLAVWLIRGIPSSLKAQCPALFRAKNHL